MKLTTLIIGLSCLYSCATAQLSEEQKEIKLYEQATGFKVLEETDNPGAVKFGECMQKFDSEIGFSRFIEQNPELGNIYAKKCLEEWVKK